MRLICWRRGFCDVRRRRSLKQSTVATALVGLAMGVAACGIQSPTPPTVTPSVIATLPGSTRVGPTIAATISPTSLPSPAQPSGTFAPTGSMAEPRAAQTATLLHDGRVLIAGGVDDEVVLNSAELYDPKTGTFSREGSMASSRVRNTATLLQDGRVLVAGGEDYAGSSSKIFATAEIYDPSTGAFGPTGPMTTARSWYTATLLNDGRVLMAGGYDAKGTTLSSAELYDPKTGNFSRTGSMRAARFGQTATLLPDGRVLIVGGFGDPTSAELYDPVTASFESAGPTGVALYGHSATLLADGRVLLAGGYEDLTGAILYDPATGQFTRTGSMTEPRYNQTATLLTDGRVLVAEGNRSSADLYEPKTGTFSRTGSLPLSKNGSPVTGSTATLLPDGRVLVAGGAVFGQGDVASAWLYQA